MRSVDAEIQGVLEQALARMTPEEWAAHDRRIQAERAREHMAQVQAREKARREELKQWGVPRKDIERVLAGKLDENEPLEVARAYMAALRSCSRGDTPRSTLVLSGPVGCGKTTAAAYLLAAYEAPWARHPHPPVFVAVSRLIRWNRFDDKSMAALERASALVVDDLGSEYIDDKGAFLSFFDGLLNARYADWLPTVITTNLTASQFAGRYGARSVDRLREVGQFVEISAASMRRRGPQAAAEPR